MMPVCKKCAFLHGSAKSDPPYRWMCTARPLEATYNPVVGEDIADPPYAFCRFVNTNTHPCEMFESGNNVFFPREMPA